MNNRHSNKNEDVNFINSLVRITKVLAGIIFILLTVALFIGYQLNSERKPSITAQGEKAAKGIGFSGKANPNEAHPDAIGAPQIVNGKDVQTGLLEGKGLQTVITSCTACHSSKLITQNRLTREEWHKKIVWMQETQGLWDLGKNEAVILDYLAENYAPQQTGGRRAPLRNIQWYELKD